MEGPARRGSELAEVLTQILGHLHQPFHFHNYANALLGSGGAPPSTRPWNPVGLQLVCRRWRALAQPLFYRQIALDCRHPDALETLADDLAGPKDPYIGTQMPTSHTKLLVVIGAPKTLSMSDAIVEPMYRIALILGTEIISSADDLRPIGQQGQKHTLVFAYPLLEHRAHIFLGTMA